MTEPTLSRGMQGFADDPEEKDGISRENKGRGLRVKFGFIELFVVGVLTLFGQGSKGDAVPLG